VIIVICVMVVVVYYAWSLYIVIVINGLLVFSLSLSTSILEEGLDWIGLYDTI